MSRQRPVAVIASGFIIVRASVIVLSWILVAQPVCADYFDDVGYSQLQSELGAALPTGSGIPVAQIEAKQSGNYGPDLSIGEFSGKTLLLQSGATGVSSHASGMARRFFGNLTSTAPGVTEVKVWEANHWVSDGFLKAGAAEEPLVETQDVQNHSWIGDLGSSAENIDVLRRLDYVIERDDVFVAVGVDNTTTMILPPLLGQSYNAVSIGESSGTHSFGFTTLDGAGRIKPEIVAPTNSTSRSTARVSSAASMLLEHAMGTEAVEPQSMKAILLAGATKDEFALDWDRTSARPLDDVYGAGELNIYRSYHVLDAGEQPASSSSNVNPMGWDFNATTAGGRTYFFEVPEGHRLEELSAVLTWHRDVTDGDPEAAFVPESSLENLDLALYAADNFTLGSLIDSSNSSVDNVEHIYLNHQLGIGGAGLGAGQYALEVQAGTVGVDYSLAFLSESVLLGDMNVDGVLDFDDIDAFILALNNPSAYFSQYGVVDQIHGDTDGDGDHDFDDIQVFVELLRGMVMASQSTAVPEPSTFGLVMAVMFVGLVAPRATARARRDDTRWPK